MARTTVDMTGTTPIRKRTRRRRVATGGGHVLPGNTNAVMGIDHMSVDERPSRMPARNSRTHFFN